jgi:hypothetical protein
MDNIFRTVGFYFLTAMAVNSTVFNVVTPCTYNPEDLYPNIQKFCYCFSNYFMTPLNGINPVSPWHSPEHPNVIKT